MPTVAVRDRMRRFRSEVPLISHLRWKHAGMGGPLLRGFWLAELHNLPNRPGSSAEALPAGDSELLADVGRGELHEVPEVEDLSIAIFELQDPPAQLRSHVKRLEQARMKPVGQLALPAQGGYLHDGTRRWLPPIHIGQQTAYDLRWGVKHQA
jgi:hypothetical protein